MLRMVHVSEDLEPKTMRNGAEGEGGQYRSGDHGAQSLWTCCVQDSRLQALLKVSSGDVDLQ